MSLCWWSGSAESHPLEICLKPWLLFRVEYSHWLRLSRYCALIGWDHSVATPALLCYKDKTQGTRDISRLLLVLFGISIGGFHVKKESILGAGVSNTMIPPIMDCLCAYPPVTVSLCDSRTSSAPLFWISAICPDLLWAKYCNPSWLFFSTNTSLSGLYSCDVCWSFMGE